MGDEPVIIATSIYPRDLEKQKAAIDSWLKLGFEVVSINAPDEMKKVKGYFPSIKFIEAERDATKEVGKPCIFFDDIVSFLRRSGGEINGIVNSDVFLHADSNFPDFIKREAVGSLLFGPRLDIDNLDRIEGRFYSYGFDYFFFDKAILSSYPQSEFCLGMPWWDYWAPMVLMMKGIPVKRVVTPVIYHLDHEQNFSLYPWIKFGQAFGEYLGLPGMSKRTLSSVSDTHLAGKEYADFPEIAEIGYFAISLINGFSQRLIYTPSRKSTLYAHGKTLIKHRRLECVKKMLLSYRQGNGHDSEVESLLSPLEDLLGQAKRLNRFFEEFYLKDCLKDARNILLEESRLAQDIHNLHNNLGMIYWRLGSRYKAVQSFLWALSVELDPKATLLNYGGLLEKTNWAYEKRKILQKLYRWRYPDVKECEGYFILNPEDGAIVPAEMSVFERPGRSDKSEDATDPCLFGSRDRDVFLRNVSGVIHVGANTGQERDQYTKYGLRVIWIEPVPEVFETLKKKLSGFPEQQALHYLVTDQDDQEYPFHVAGNDGLSSSILDPKLHRDIWPQAALEKTITLKSSTLVSLLDKEGIALHEYESLVVDTQGSELLVLKGAAPILHNFRYIKIEVPDFASNAGRCQISVISSFLAPYRYRERSRYKFSKRSEVGSHYEVIYERTAYPPRSPISPASRGKHHL